MFHFASAHGFATVKSTIVAGGDDARKNRIIQLNIFYDFHFGDYKSIRYLSRIIAYCSDYCQVESRLHFWNMYDIGKVWWHKTQTTMLIATFMCLDPPGK